jgi:rubrerythrin
LTAQGERIMSVTFNADEVLQMAEDIERSAGGFYREAAQKTSTDMKKMFLNMASMEDGHLRVFQAMHKELTASEKEPLVFDPYDEGALYLQALAESKGNEGLKAPTIKLTGRESARELLEIAIGAEKNSVLFYVGLKSLVPADAGKDKVEAVIREEVRHVADLKRQMGKL